MGKEYIKIPSHIKQEDLILENGDHYLTVDKVYEYDGRNIIDDVGDKLTPLTSRHAFPCAHLSFKESWVFCNEQGEEL